MTETIPWLVQVWYQDEGEEWHFHGNGVVVDKNAVLTCKHVTTLTNGAEELEPRNLQIRYDQNQVGICTVERSNREDLAILRLEQPVHTSLPDFCTDVQRTDLLGVRAWQWRGDAPEIQGGDSIQCTEVVRDRLWYFDYGIPNGFSGGPLLLDAKRRTTIVGVIEEGGKGQARSAVIPPSLICEFLKGHKVEVREKPRWFWLARKVGLSVVALLMLLGVLLNGMLGKSGLVIATCILSLIAPALVWMGVAMQKGERRSDHLLYPFLEWLDSRKLTLIFVAALSMLSESIFVGWSRFARAPQVVTQNVWIATTNTAQFIRYPFGATKTRTSVVEVVRAVPASTELDVMLASGFKAGAVNANTTCVGSIANDVRVPGNPGAGIPKGTRVKVRMVRDGSSVRFELASITLNGADIETSTSAGANSSGAIVELPLNTGKLNGLTGGGDKARIGAGVGWLAGFAFGHKGKHFQTASKAATIGSQIGSKIGSDGTQIQTVNSIAAGEVLAFRLSAPVDLKL
jgi:hypothetical protein